MIAEITTFASVVDRSGRRHRVVWEKLFERFGHPVETSTTEALALWAPATFRNDSRTTGSVVELVYALVLDFDTGGSLELAAGVFRRFSGLLHTTHGHAPAAPRFRVVLPFAAPLPPQDYPALWLAADRFCHLHALGPDPSCKNASRVWYVPGKRPEGSFETRRFTGTLLDPKMFASPRAKTRPRPRASSVSKLGAKLADRDRRLQRASAYLERLPSSVSGERGHDALWRAALAMVCGFALEPHQAFELLKREFSPRCQPPWADRDIAHKVRDAANARVPVGYLASAPVRTACR
jgi:hypothetical protein